MREAHERTMARHGKAGADLRNLFDDAVRAVMPGVVMPAMIPCSPHGRTCVIAIGKAAAEMMRVALERAPIPLAGLVVTRHGHLPESGCDWPGVELIEAGHPIPDSNSLRAAERALAIAGSLDRGDHLLALLSGGGSALAAAPVEGIALADKQRMTSMLLESGATIREINCVRKHLSRIKGGRLAVAAAPARVTTWLISDVPGDDPGLVSSGPTVADHGSLDSAREIVARYGIEAPPAIVRALSDPANETPPSLGPCLAGGEIRVLASAGTALAAAAALARRKGYRVSDLGGSLEGEARQLGESHAALARRLARDGRARAILSGGEATVRLVDRRGKGGRNLEYLLGLAIALDGAPGISALACDTDGIDGSGNAAGAMVFSDTIERARTLGLDPADHLARNASFSFFEALGDLVVTGPTMTNVNDFRAILIEKAGEQGRERARRSPPRG